MNVRRAAAGAALAAATLSAVPAAATADNPEDPANGIIPAGAYHITQHPDNMIGSPVHNCDLQAFADSTTVTLVCGNSTRTGRQNAAGPDETYVTFEGVPVGLDLREIDARQGYWEGTLNAAGTSIDVPYPIAGITLQRR